MPVMPKVTDDGRKWCNSCQGYKPFDAFHKDARTPTGLSAYCRECISTRANHKPRVRAPKGFKFCPDCERTLTIEQFYPDRNTRRHICSECEIKRQRERRKLPSMKAVQKRSNDKRRASGAVRLYMRDYSRQYERQKRARRRGLPATFTHADWQRAVEYFNGCCAVCRRPLSDLFQTHKGAADHWQPESKGGGYTPDNIIPLCHGLNGCNNKKQNRLPDEWLVSAYGKKQATQIINRINQYFTWVKEQQS